MSRTISVEHNGVTYTGTVMTIRSTMLGAEDHDIFTAYLHCEAPGSGVGVGGYSLDSYDESHKRRIGTAYGVDHLKALMHAVGVSKWEDLPGRDVIVLHEGKTVWGTRAVGIAHISDEKRVLILQEHANEWRNEQVSA